MDVLSRDDLELLVRQPRSSCASLYMPTHRSGPETQQDPIRLKNLIRRAEESLVAAGIRRPDASEVLRPARELIEDEAFWRHQSDGLALFLRTGWFRCYRLPLRFEEAVVVSDRFHVSPLLPLLSGDGRFFVLALSENEARLLAGTRFAVHEVNVPGLPAGVRDALRYDDPQREVGSHAAERGGPGARVVLHGQGIGAESQKERLSAIFRPLTAQCADPYGRSRLPSSWPGLNMFGRCTVTSTPIPISWRRGSAAARIGRQPKSSIPAHGRWWSPTSHAPGTLQRPPTEELSAPDVRLTAWRMC